MVTIALRNSPKWNCHLRLHPQSRRDKQLHQFGKSHALRERPRRRPERWHESQGCAHRQALWAGVLADQGRPMQGSTRSVAFIGSRGPRDPAGARFSCPSFPPPLPSPSPILRIAARNPWSRSRAAANSKGAPVQKRFRLNTGLRVLHEAKLVFFEELQHFGRLLVPKVHHDNASDWRNP
jgi:hypothetical protein